MGNETHSVNLNYKFVAHPNNIVFLVPTAVSNKLYTPHSFLWQHAYTHYLSFYLMSFLRYCEQREWNSLRIDGSRRHNMTSFAKASNGVYPCPPFDIFAYSRV